MSNGKYLSGMTRADVLMRLTLVKDKYNLPEEVIILLDEMHSALERGYTIGFDLTNRRDETSPFYLIGKHILAELYDDDNRRNEVKQLLVTANNKL